MMRLHPEDLGLWTEVLWYYVPENRPWIPYANPFGSRDWEIADGRGEALLGEVAGTRSYYSGTPPVDLDGQGFCGSRAQWERGVSIYDKPLPLNPTTQQQCCCGSGGAGLAAPSVEGMIPEIEMPPTIQTYCKPSNSAQHWEFNIAGVVDQAAPCNNLSTDFNKLWYVSHLSACTWQSASVAICSGAFSGRWFLVWNHPGNPGIWTLRFTNVITGTTIYARYWCLQENFNINGATTMNLLSVLFPGSNFPATVTIVPSFGP